MSGTVGLRDVVAVESRISAIVDDELTYRGIAISELFARSNFEEVTFLLWFGRLPSLGELGRFRERLGAAEVGPDLPLDQIEADRIVEAAVAGLALSRQSASAPHDQAIRLLVGLPSIVATFDRLRRRLDPVNQRSTGSIAEIMLTVWHDRVPADADRALLDRSLLLVADHELNAATFAARVAASTRADLGSAILAAAATHGGPLHGGAARFTGELLSAATPEEAAAEVGRRFDAGERIPGFGHPVYRRGDPRVPLFRLLAEERARATGDRQRLDVADRIAAIVAKRTGLLPNMDLYAAVCWLSLGFPADLLPAIFAIGRMAGWVAHVLEQAADNRLIRPRARYVGPANQPYIPIEDRP